ncbi:MAG: VanW family protein [Deltaproteobacteria bacterium]|nr:VanW family protein [Deltaproteobacteria bacterium]
MPGLEGLFRKGSRGRARLQWRIRRQTRVLISVLLLLLLFGSSVLLYQRSLQQDSTLAGVWIGGEELGPLTRAELPAALDQFAARVVGRTFAFRVGKYGMRVTVGDLGAKVDSKLLEGALIKIGKTGDVLDDIWTRVQARRGRLTLPVPLTLDKERAMGFFQQLKGRVDRSAIEPRMDLEKQQVIAGRRGFRLRLFEAIAVTETALRAGKSFVELPVTVIQPKRGSQLANIDISHVLASYSTVYSLADKDRDRSHNLKVGASKIDGFVLQPGDTFSFNKVVGARTRKEGYRMAAVISQGELVDGMAGGACQLSSTLFAASFFAGLTLESSRPHTIPSGYIKMGLDAAVAYPTTDLVLKNPYAFAVVLHLKVSRGKVHVRLLGKKRPYRRIEFKRILKRQEPFKRETRDAPSLPKGVNIVSQRGIPGFVIERRRLFYAEGKNTPIKVEKRELRYPPTTEYTKQGSGPPQPDFKAPRSRSPFGEVKPEYTLSQ